MWVNDRVQNVLTSLGNYPERSSTNHNAAIPEFRKAAHPFGLKLQAIDFFHTSSKPEGHRVPNLVDAIGWRFE